MALGNLKLERDKATKPPTYTEYINLPWLCQPSDIPIEAAKLYAKAEDNYQLTIAQVPTTTTVIKAKINLLNLLLKTNNLSKAETLLSKINISNLPQNQTQVYAQNKI
ncbi:MAG: hypothetical protein HC836_46070 [Richelia sp. RM2_1_2]|nr:hypothetical protein [Richelia sp. RM2_1_2]